MHRQNDGLQRQNERLRRENEHLKQQLGAERRAGRRQAAPFAKDRPQGLGGRPGRRPGARYGRQGRRPCPARVDETLAAPAPTTCPDCGGAVNVTGAASQYQEDLPPVRPLVRRFDIEVGHCSQCRRRIQGRHALQTSDALGAASAQLGPGVVALVVELHTHTHELRDCGFPDPVRTLTGITLPRPRRAKQRKRGCALRKLANL